MDTSTIEQESGRLSAPTQGFRALPFTFAKQFGVLLGANLLCRLPSPQAFLTAAAALVARGGLLVMPSPYTWLEHYTPKAEWIGAVDARSSFEHLQATLDSEWELVVQRDMPFIIRETKRKNQLTFSHLTVWRRK